MFKIVFEVRVVVLVIFVGFELVIVCFNLLYGWCLNYDYWNLIVILSVFFKFVCFFDFLGVWEEVFLEILILGFDWGEFYMVVSLEICNLIINVKSFIGVGVFWGFV